MEARGALGERVYAAGGVGLDHNAVFGFAATPRVSMATYLRRPSDHGTVGDTKLTFNAGTGIKAPSIAQQASSLFGLLSSASPGATLISTSVSRRSDLSVAAAWTLVSSRGCGISGQGAGDGVRRSLRRSD